MRAKLITEIRIETGPDGDHLWGEFSKRETFQSDPQVGDVLKYRMKSGAGKVPLPITHRRPDPSRQNEEEIRLDGSAVIADIHTLNVGGWQLDHP